MLLLDAVQGIAFGIGSQFKDVFALPRPCAIAPDIAPVVQTPAHGSFPSGHATESFAAATVMGALFPDRAKNLRLIAARIADNRVFGGVHYPVDGHAGAILGDLLGKIILSRLFAPTFPEPGPSEGFKTEDRRAAGAPYFSSLEEYAQNHTVPPKANSAIGKPPILNWLAGEVIGEMDR
jgi:membrane-associated phospholipid phosphatase